MLLDTRQQRPEPGVSGFINKLSADCSVYVYGRRTTGPQLLIRIDTDRHRAASGATPPNRRKWHELVTAQLPAQGKGEFRLICTQQDGAMAERPGPKLRAPHNPRDQSSPDDLSGKQFFRLLRPFNLQPSATQSCLHPLLSIKRPKKGQRPVKFRNNCCNSPDAQAPIPHMRKD